MVLSTLQAAGQNWIATSIGPGIYGSNTMEVSEDQDLDDFCCERSDRCVYIHDRFIYSLDATW